MDSWGQPALAVAMFSPQQQMGSGGQPASLFAAAPSCMDESSDRSCTSHVALAFLDSIVPNHTGPLVQSSAYQAAPGIPSPSVASFVGPGPLGGPVEPTPPHPAAVRSHQAGKKQTGYRKLWALVNSVKHGDVSRAAAEDVSVSFGGPQRSSSAAGPSWEVRAATAGPRFCCCPWSLQVEGLIKMVQQLPAAAPVIEAILPSLHYLDSRALAALLKGLAKAGLGQRAVDIFDHLRCAGREGEGKGCSRLDWLSTAQTPPPTADAACVPPCVRTRRGLPPNDELAALCDIYTYTTMISQCTTHHQLRRAMELVAEMRSKAITLNVHTYSALLNVCLKANELDLSLDVYGRMLAEGVAPNLVTYNTLLDIYNKTGRWRDALNVLELLQHQVGGRWPHRPGCCVSAGGSGGLWAVACRDTVQWASSTALLWHIEIP